MFAEKFSLPAEYIKALAVIECSGRKIIPPRFEKGVYEKLKLVKKSDTAKLENITHKLLKNTPDSVLRDMAKSWGPLQLMGYKCVWLNVDIEELKGEKILFYSVKWINETYGDYLRQEKYKDAFHIHNAGKPYPKNGKPNTFDPEYVKNGMKYMKYFQEQAVTKKIEKKIEKEDF